MFNVSFHLTSILAVAPWWRKDHFQMKTIHTRLRAIREDLGLSERALAQRLGEVGPEGWSVTHTTISNYEDGSTRSVPHEFLDALSSLSDYRMEWIVTGELPKKKTKPKTDAIKLDVIGMVYNEEVDVVALKQIADRVRGVKKDAGQVQATLAAHERGVEPPPVGREGSGGASEGDPPEDRSTDQTNGSPDKNHHAGP